jgi:hypothetical protein
MRFRFFGGWLAAVGVAGAAHAQTPKTSFSFLNENQPAARVGQVRAIQTPIAGEGLMQAGFQAAGQPSLMPAAKPQPAPATPASPAALPSTPASTTLTQGCGVGSACTSCPTYACDPCGPCGPCGPAGRFWVAAEYLYWTTSGNPIPPLVTAAPDGNPRTNAGNLGDPGTQILFGGQRYNNDWRSGFRVSGGMWLDECNTCGLESDFFMLGRSRDGGRFNSNTGRTIVSRPFFNALTGQQDTQLVKFPNVLYGSVSVDSKSSLWGTGGNLIKNISCDPCGRCDLLIGGRYLNLTDELTIREDLTSLPGASGVPNGTRFQIQDRFRTENNIYAGTIGFATERRFSHYFVGVRSTVGLGWNHQVTEISGSTTITPPGGQSTTYAGGLLTQPSNIGRYTSNRFVVVPEVGLKLGVQLTEHARAYVGYNFLYVSNVARSGDQVDLRVNTNQIPPSQGLGGGPALPAYTNNKTDFWAQGISLGLEFRF